MVYTRLKKIEACEFDEFNVLEVLNISLIFCCDNLNKLVLGKKIILFSRGQASVLNLLVH